MILAFVNQKGGVGKTTLATNLACAFAREGRRTHIVDADPQGTATNWHAARGGGEGEEGTVECTFAPEGEARGEVESIGPAADVVLIDTPGTLSGGTVSTIKAADLVLLPVMPSAGDLWAAGDAVELLKGAPDTEARFVVSCAKVRTRLSAEVDEALNTFPFQVLGARTHNREVYKRALGAGRSVLGYDAPKACAEILEIAKEVSGAYRNSHSPSP
jgi:chromosome partitioning protein